MRYLIKLYMILGLISVVSLKVFAADSSSDSSSQQSAVGEDSGRRGGGPHGHHGPPPMTDAQRTCLEGILGKPGEGERPSKEVMEAALNKCGVQKPEKKSQSSSSSSDSESDGAQ